MKKLRKHMALLDRFKKTEKKKDQPQEKRPAPAKKMIGQTESIYNHIVAPHITEKAGFLAEQGKYVFRVTREATKSEVAKSIAALYGVKVAKVSIVRAYPKKRRLGKSRGWKEGLKKGFKKAVVSLAPGEKIEVL